MAIKVNIVNFYYDRIAYLITWNNYFSYSKIVSLKSRIEIQ